MQEPCLTTKFKADIRSSGINTPPQHVYVSNRTKIQIAMGGVDALPLAVPAPLPLLAILASRKLASRRKTAGNFGALPLRLIFLVWLNALDITVNPINLPTRFIALPLSRIWSSSPVLGFVCQLRERARTWLNESIDMLQSLYCMSGIQSASRMAARPPEDAKKWNWTKFSRAWCVEGSDQYTECETKQCVDYASENKDEETD
ncbi:hypothetical protein F4604DRAFT_1686946 [Suillus subluteus]|nr:hypothetical protein F4604DRAFT_1686946 [Suillus subluteus]